MKAHFILIREIAFQKLRKNPDKAMIQALQILYDKDKVSYADFVNTGRIMPTAYYKQEFGEMELNENCENVCRYMGGLIAQNLSDGKWEFNYVTATDSMFYVSDDLKMVEQFMWEKVINN
jgi:hypothetical protein